MSLVGHKPPPIFRRGPAPLVRLLLFVCVCLAMLVSDLRFRYLEMFRHAMSVVTYPLQMAAATPADFLRNAPDPFARKVILDRGAQQGIEPGLAVVDAVGVIGQVTRVFPVQSEVTLLTDRNQAIPVQVERNGLRGVLFGAGQGRLEMRFVIGSADIQPGDRLVTSGLDGVFVPGLPVATVVSVDREGDAFAGIVCAPLAGVERSMQVLVIGRMELPPPPPAAEPPVEKKKGKGR